jgi:PAS domain S-box-containing protein
MVEDSRDDADLILRTLGQAGFNLSARRVQTAVECHEALTSEVWDLVVSDFSLPQFSAMNALHCLHEHALDLPFIVVSGTIDEESAVSILKAGAHDFVTKQNMARLGPAIRRELQDARDRGQRRDAQRDLQTQRDMLRLVIDTNPSLISLKDATGGFVLANQAVADLYGNTVADLIGQSDASLREDTDDVTRALARHHDVLQTGQSRCDEDEPMTDLRTGAQRWFETRRVPLELPDGTRQVLEIGTEVTDRRAAQEALRLTEEQFRQAQKMEAVGQLAGGIAHDFNNLLTAILGYSELLLEEVADQPGVVADLQEIQQAGERARGLIAQLLAISRKQVLEPRVLDLNALVSEIEQMLRRVIAADIRFDIDMDPNLRPVHADPGQLHQVLMNLCINARDAMPRGGTLRISTANVHASAQAPDPWVMLTVSDSGSGMTPEVKARVFEPFYTTKGPGKGTGLGLSMVYGVITGSGGRIAIDSERDRGTTITIHLPVAVARTGGTVTSAGPEELRGTETILLVEDEVALRQLIRKALHHYGYQVLEAVDVNHALELAERHPGPLHLLLSDIVMPILSGPDVALRVVQQRPGVKVLYMSGISNRGRTAIGGVGPSVDFLEKPFTPRALALRVRECLTR